MGDNVAKRPLLHTYLSFHVVGAGVSVGLDKAIKFLSSCDLSLRSYFISTSLCQL